MVLPKLPGPEFEYQPEYGDWVTPKLTKKRPIYNWFLFPHSYDKNRVHGPLDDRWNAGG